MGTHHFTRVLIVGAGLIGTSVALARRAHGFAERFDAVEPSRTNREILDSMTGLFDHVYDDCSKISKSYDLLILSAPPKVSLSLMEWALDVADVVVDVCSVKREICEAARRLPTDRRRRFIASHPMAGKASGGPKDADACLFEQKTWFIIHQEHEQDYVDDPLDQTLAEWISGTGAVPIRLDDANKHDELMSFVSHGIHVASLAAMLASDDRAKEVCADDAASYAGPAFWDITRLAASPPDFWLDTLLSNRTSVGFYIEKLIEQLGRIQTALQSNQPDLVTAWLTEAQRARRGWEEDRRRQMK